MQPQRLQHLGIKIIRKLDITHTHKRGIFHISVAAEEVITRIEHGTRYDRDIAILTPAPVHGGTLVIGVEHLLEVHLCRIHYLNALTVVEACL